MGKVLFVRKLLESAGNNDWSQERYLAMTRFMRTVNAGIPTVVKYNSDRVHDRKDVIWRR